MTIPGWASRVGTVSAPQPWRGRAQQCPPAAVPTSSRAHQQQSPPDGVDVPHHRQPARPRSGRGTAVGVVAIAAVLALAAPSSAQQAASAASPEPVVVSNLPAPAALSPLLNTDTLAEPNRAPTASRSRNDRQFLTAAQLLTAAPAPATPAAAAEEPPAAPPPASPAVIPLPAPPPAPPTHGLPAQGRYTSCFCERWASGTAGWTWPTRAARPRSRRRPAR